MTDFTPHNCTNHFYSYILFKKKKKRRGNRGKKNHLISNSSFKNTTAAGPAPGTGVAAGPVSRDPAVEGTAGRQTAVWMGRMSSRSL